MFASIGKIFLLFTLITRSRPDDSIKRHATDPYQEIAQLRDGKEMNVHLKSGETKQYSFRVREDDTSLWLVVTPCGGTIKWKVTHQSDDGHVDEADADDEGSGQPSTDAKRDYLAPSRDNLATTAPQLRVNQIREATLLREVGRASMEYVRDSMPSGVLHLYMTTAEENGTAARVYVTTESAKIDAYFPKLPRRQRITLSNITDRQVTLAWEHSPSVNLFKQNDVRYCLALSATKEYSTYCEVLEEQARRSRTQKQQQTAKDSNFLRSQPASSANDQKLTVVCTQYKTGYQFADLDSDTKYHLSLFAVNTKTGGSSAYGGSSFVTRNSKSAGSVSDTAPVRLKDGQMYASYLNPARASFRLYEIYVHHFRRQILISVQPCSGYIRVNLYKDGQLLRKSAFSELKVFAVTNVKPGVLRIKVVNDDNDAKVYKIWSSVRPSRNPYPLLPFDTSIKSLENGRTCTSVTLAWLGSTEKHDYCLYRRMEREDYFKQLILEETDQCQGPAAKMEQVFCRRFKVENDSQLIMKAAVFDLKPATTYRFDLYASKPNRQPLSYRTVWVKTKREC